MSQEERNDDHLLSAVGQVEELLATDVEEALRVWEVGQQRLRATLQSGNGFVARMGHAWLDLYLTQSDHRFLNATLKSVDALIKVGRHDRALIKTIEVIIQRLSALPCKQALKVPLVRPQWGNPVRSSRELSILVLSGPRSSFTEAVLTGLMESGLRPRAIIVERTDRLAHLYGSYYRFRVGADFYERYENDPGPWYRPNGRSSFLLPTDAARQHGVKSHVVETMNGEEARSLVAHYSPDVCVLSGVGLINNLDEPRVGILNTHSGVLPTFRGLDNVAWSMLEGSPVGCSIHFVDAGVDTGPILATHALSEEECVAGVKLSLKYAKVRLLTEALRSIARGTPPRFEQAESAGRRFYRMHPLLRCVLAQRYERFGVSAFVGNMNWGDDV